MTRLILRMIVRADFVQMNGVAALLFVDIRGYGALERCDGIECAASDPAIRDLGKEAFDAVEPRRTRWREMDIISRMRCEPCLDFTMHVGSVDAQDQVQSEFPGNRSIDMFQELDELFVPVTRDTTLDNFPSERGKRSEQSLGCGGAGCGVNSGCRSWRLKAVVVGPRVAVGPGNSNR
jgi:hypothetical protein